MLPPSGESARSAGNENRTPGLRKCGSEGGCCDGEKQQQGRDTGHGLGLIRLTPHCHACSF
jgi:hypothetical protein